MGDPETTTRRRTMQHAFHANVFVYIGPVDALTIAENFKILSLLCGGFRQTP
jgi:hypothetical protein